MILAQALPRKESTMAKLLFVTCELKPAEQSCCLIAGSEFLNEYIRRNPEDEIHMLDLFRDNIQHSDDDVLRGLDKMRCGYHFAVLGEDEQRKIGRIEKLIEHFTAMDKYVFVTPMRNTGLPVELRMYMDTVSVVSRTHLHTPLEFGRIVKQPSKKCLLIHSVDGFDSHGKEVCCVSDIRSAMKMMGIEKFEALSVKSPGTILEYPTDYLGDEIDKVLYSAAIF
jgi:FMN-dependent NADH-azoreductase